MLKEPYRYLIVFLFPVVVGLFIYIITTLITRLSEYLIALIGV